MYWGPTWLGNGWNVEGVTGTPAIIQGPCPWLYMGSDTFKQAELNEWNTYKPRVMTYLT